MGRHVWQWVTQGWKVGRKAGEWGGETYLKEKEIKNTHSHCIRKLQIQTALKQSGQTLPLICSPFNLPLFTASSTQAGLSAYGDLPLKGSQTCSLAASCCPRAQGCWYKHCPSAWCSVPVPISAGPPQTAPCLETQPNASCESPKALRNKEIQDESLLTQTI